MENIEEKKHYPYRERKVLILDLEKDEFSLSVLPSNICKKVLGGKALAHYLWDKYADYSKLGSEYFFVGSPIVIALGAASDLCLPYCISSCIVTYNIESCSLVSYNFSNQNFVSAMASLNINAIVIKGRSRRLTNIEISKDFVNFKVDESLHLLTTREVEKKLNDAISIISIGPAGETCSVYSSIVINKKIVGRSGLGAIFGIKNIKVVSFYTEKSCRNGYFDDLNEKFSEFILPKKIGEESLIPYSNKFGWAAIENFKYRYDPRLWGLGGTSLTPNCKTDWLYALAIGSNLGFYSYKSVDIIEQCCIELGLDPIGIGILILWLEKAMEEKIILLKKDNNVSRLENILKFLEDLSFNKSHIEKFGYSVDSLSEYYGNEKNNFSSSSKELLPLDLRALPSFALAVSIDDDTFVPFEMLNKPKKKKTALALYNSQILREFFENLGFSWKELLPLFAREGGIKESKNLKLVKKFSTFFAVSEGYFLDEKKLINKAKISFFLSQSLKRKVKKTKGSIDNIPSYFLNEKSSNHKDEQLVTIGGSLDDYYSILKMEKEKIINLESK